MISVYKTTQSNCNKIHAHPVKVHERNCVIRNQTRDSGSKFKQKLEQRETIQARWLGVLGTLIY